MEIGLAAKPGVAVRAYKVLLDDYSADECISCEALVDSGASHHLTSDKSLFHGVVRRANLGIRGIEGEGQLRATGVGRGSLMIDGCVIGLSRLYYVPGLTETLISVSALVEDENEVSMRKVDGVNTLSVVTRDGARGVVRAMSGLYAVHGGGGDGGAIWVDEVDDDTSSALQGYLSVGGRHVGNTYVGDLGLGALLHRRLGHILWGSGKLGQRLRSEFGPKAGSCAMASCSHCARAKMRRMVSRSPPTRPATRPLERIHFDLSPAIPCTGTGGAKGFMLIVDEFTRMVFCYTIKHKSEVPDVLERFRLMAEKHFRQSVGGITWPIELEAMRSDGESVNTSARVHEWCKGLGIVHEVSAPYAQWQDGIVERYIGTVWAGSEAMRKAAGAPQATWVYSLFAFIHTLNRVAKGEADDSPYELWHRVSIPLAKRVAPLRTWGCKCYVLVPEALRRKLGDKARVCIFLGYSARSKAYLCMDVATRKVLSSTSVIFDETSMPFSDTALRARMRADTASEQRSFDILYDQLVGGTVTGDVDGAGLVDDVVVGSTTGDEEVEAADIAPRDEVDGHEETHETDDVLPDDESEAATSAAGGALPDDESVVSASDDDEVAVEAVAASDDDADPDWLHIVDSVPLVGPQSGEQGIRLEESRIDPANILDDDVARGVRKHFKAGGGAFTRADRRTSTIFRGQYITPLVRPFPAHVALPGPVADSHFATVTVGDLELGRIRNGAAAMRPLAVGGSGPLVAMRAALSNMPCELPDDDYGIHPIRKTDLKAIDYRLRLERKAVEDDMTPATAAKVLHRIQLLALAAKAPAPVPGSLKATAPNSFRDAVNSINARGWWEAMDAEIDNMGEFGAWKLVQQPPGVGSVGCRWVYAIKRDALGIITKLKARLVVQGNTMVKGRDFNETWSPTCRIRTFRFMLAEAAAINHAAGERVVHTRTWDATGAFLHADMDADVYMRQPEGYQLRGREMVCKLLRAVYGCRQSGRLWHAKIHAAMMALGDKLGCSVEQGKADECLYTIRRGDAWMRCLQHVDDSAVSFNDMALYNAVLAEIQKEFAMNESPMDMFLGIRVVDNDAGGYELSQSGYIAETLARMNLQDCFSALSPEATGTKAKLVPLDAPLSPPEARFMAQVPYVAAVGALHYLARATRPDISHAVGQVARFMASPGPLHWAAVLRIWGYLRRTKDIALHVRGGKMGVHARAGGLSGFSDSDWAGCQESRRSHTGWVVFAGDTPMAWYSKRQESISQSTAEAEFVAACSLGNELVWWRLLAADFGQPITEPLPLFCDNTAATALAKHAGRFQSTKHIELRYLKLRERQQCGEIVVEWVSAEKQFADIFTKNCGVADFRQMASQLLGEQL